MRIAPLDIQEHQFKVKFRGFDREEVESFLEFISNELRDLTQENNALKAGLKEKETMITEYREREKSINESIAIAQKITEDIKSNAEKEAKLIISDAEMKAEKIIDNANRELADITKEVLDLKKQRVQFDSALRSLVEAHQKILDIDRDESRRDEQA
ncbi:MAG: DivIVA domain-containing protein [Pseudomonadota bacterium]